MFYTRGVHEQWNKYEGDDTLEQDGMNKDVNGATSLVLLLITRLTL